MFTQSALFHEYFYNRFAEIDDEQRDLICTIRTKPGLIFLCEKLQTLEVKKRLLADIYDDLKYFCR